jgi:DNA-binding NarL/FixJ family response regulator
MYVPYCPCEKTKILIPPAPDKLRASQPDVVVISARLEDGPLTGFRILHGLRAVESKIPSVMLLDSTERDLVVDAFRGGARGIFCRGDSFNALPKCINLWEEWPG